MTFQEQATYIQGWLYGLSWLGTWSFQPLASQHWLLCFVSQAKLASCRCKTGWVTRGHFDCHTSSACLKPHSPITPILCHP